MSYTFWYMAYCFQPEIALLGMLGILGKEAKKAAEDFGLAVGLLLCILIILAVIGGAVYLFLDFIGVV